jgi:hypothetical protein
MYENTVMLLKYAAYKTSQEFYRNETSNQLIDAGMYRTLPRD